MKKYELSKDHKLEFNGIVLYRIRALINFETTNRKVLAGDLGGYVEKETNLSHEDKAWVFENAKVYGEAKVCGNAKVYGEAKVYGKAKVYGDAEVCGNAKVYGDAEVCGNAKVYGEAKVCGKAKVCGNALCKTYNDFISITNLNNSSCTFSKTKDNKIEVYFDWILYSLQKFEKIIENWNDNDKSAGKAAIELAKAHIKLKDYPFGFCRNCQDEFNSELRYEYEITHCPWCGTKIEDKLAPPY